MRRILLFTALLVIVSMPAFAEIIGQVSTKFKWMGPNDKILVEVFQDPDIPGIACYLSRAKTGGISGAVGVAEDTSDASLACRQVGPVKIPEDVASRKADGDDVFKKRTSLLTKTMQVVRFYDAPRNTLVYLSYSDRIIEGSPKNSISVVVVTPWGDTASAVMQPQAAAIPESPVKASASPSDNENQPPRVLFESGNAD